MNNYTKHNNEVMQEWLKQINEINFGALMLISANLEKGTVDVKMMKELSPDIMRQILEGILANMPKDVNQEIEALARFNKLAEKFKA